MWYYYILVVVVIILIGRTIIKSRGYFWKDRNGIKLSFREFFIRWKDGYRKITPAQQTRIIIWSFVPIFAGIIWGIVVSIMGEIYWLVLILGGSLPITTMGFISNLQKYNVQSKIDKTMRELESESNKRNRKSKKENR